jgi:hypothetical protein
MELKEVQQAFGALSVDSEMKAMAVTDAVSVPNSLSNPANEFVRIEQNGVSSIFKICVKPGSKAFRYDVEVYCPGNLKSLTKGSDDGQKGMSKTLCYEAILVAFAKTNNFGWAAHTGEVVYDCKSILYTSRPIKLEKSLIEIAAAEVPDGYDSKPFVPKVGVIVKITQNSRQPELDLTDISQYMDGRSLYTEDRTLRTFLEMVTSQMALNSDSYRVIGAGKLFTTDPRAFQPLQNGLTLRSGVKKGVKIIKNYGQSCPALVLDATTCPFYKQQVLAHTVREILHKRDWQRVKSLLDGVRVYVGRNPRRTFRICGWSEKTVDKLPTLSKQSRPRKMVQYYLEEFGMEITPHYLAVASDTQKGSKKEYFAVEDLVICDDQRVPLEKMDRELSEKLIKENAVLPHRRMSLILDHANALELFGNNVLKAFGITIDKSSNKTAIGVRKAPQIELASEKRIIPDDKTRFDMSTSKFLQTFAIQKMAVLNNFGTMRKPDMNKFIKIFVDKAREKGLSINQVEIFEFDGNWNGTFQMLKKENFTFVLYVDPRNNMDGHGKLKFCETYFKILTQHVTSERVNDVVSFGKRLTLENILAKTNCKNFGINYMPIIESCAEDYDLMKGNVLIVGYDVAHPPPMKASERRLVRSQGITVCESIEPSVVGITANSAKHPHVFVGDFFFQESRKEAVDTAQLEQRMCWILNMLKNSRPNHDKPPIIMVVRDGISEGQFEMAKEEELTALQDGCELYCKGYKPKFVFVIATKRHFKRFMVERNGRLENMAPGSVVEEKFTRTDCPEFYMQSHFPIQGTGKAVQYAIPINETNITRDQVQALLNSLCFEHQIVNSAVSLPEPVYQADELAKRGMAVYKEMKHIMPDYIPRSQPSKITVDGRALTQILSYCESELQATRFTA